MDISLPHALYLMSYTSCPIPHTLYRTPYTAHPIPHTLYLTLYTSHSIPHTLYLILYTSYSIPHTLYLTLYTSLSSSTLLTTLISKMTISFSGTFSSSFNFGTGYNDSTSSAGPVRRTRSNWAGRVTGPPRRSTTTRLRDIINHAHDIIDLVSDEEEEAVAQHEDEDEECTDCIVCYSGPKSAVNVPCGHNATCMKCAKYIKDSTSKCPVCRVHIREVIKLFRV